MVEKFVPSWLKIVDTKDNTVLREYELCQRNEDQKFGYYEYVNGDFIPVPDEDKERYYTYVKGQKIRLYDDTVQYLDNSTQYIDTGFNPRKVQAIYIGQPDGEPVKKYVELKYKYGHWIDTSFENVKVCSVCGKSSSKVGINGEAAFDYTSCPYCMAILDGGNNNGQQKNMARV